MTSVSLDEINNNVDPLPEDQCASPVKGSDPVLNTDVSCLEGHHPSSPVHSSIVKEAANNSYGYHGDYWRCGKSTVLPSSTTSTYVFKGLQENGGVLSRTRRTPKMDHNKHPQKK